MTTDKALAAIVKPLEWQLDGSTWYAKSIIGEYAVWAGYYRPPRGNGGILSGSTVDEAKAAAQAHYAASILSALDPVFLARMEKLEAENATLLRLVEERDDIIARDPELWTKFVATLPTQGGQDGE